MGQVKETAKRARASVRRRLKARHAASNGAGAGQNASTEAIAAAELWPLRELYRGRFEIEPISYGTVRDYAGSTAPSTAFTIQQRWMFFMSALAAARPIMFSVESA